MAMKKLIVILLCLPALAWAENEELKVHLCNQFISKDSSVSLQECIQRVDLQVVPNGAFDDEYMLLPSRVGTIYCKITTNSTVFAQLGTCRETFGKTAGN